MKRPWQKHYPANISAEIQTNPHDSIADLLERACGKHADRIALSCMSADLTYRQLNRYATALASYLQHEAGMKKGDRLAIMLPNVMQFPIAFMAAQKIGVVCVNTNPLYTPREMLHQFRDSGATAIVILNMFVANLEQIIAETEIRHVIVTSVGDQLPVWKGKPLDTMIRAMGKIPRFTIEAVPFKQAIQAGFSRPFEKPEVSGDDLAVLQYTGGTTGVSKGAMLLQRNIIANMLQIQAVSRSVMEEGGEVVLTALPLYHIFALSVNFLAFLAMGQRMVLVPRPVPIENTAKIFKKYDITFMTGVNTLYNALIHCELFKKHAPRHLKVALGGGMAVQEAVNKQWQTITGVPILEGYGLTEASPVTHVNPMNETRRKGSIGIPLASTDAMVVDENGKESPTGEPGELVVKGPQVMAGYWQRPEETRKTIRDGWLWTGDIARQDEDGFFYIVDRKKDMILVSGFNVYPNEVEEVLAMHPKVLEAAVIGVQDSNSGEAVKAFVVAKDKSLTTDELRKHCSELLTGYKRPKHFELRDSLPKTNVGKILRRELRSPQTPDQKPG